MPRLGGGVSHRSLVLMLINTYYMMVVDKLSYEQRSQHGSSLSPGERNNNRAREKEYNWLISIFIF